METIVKNELFEKINEVVSASTLNNVFREKYKDILDKHDVDNIKSNISEKISAIKDPLERAVVTFSQIENIEDDNVNLVNNHSDLLKLIMMLNRSKMNSMSDEKRADYFKSANKHFDKYITNFK